MYTTTVISALLVLPLGVFSQHLSTSAIEANCTKSQTKSIEIAWVADPALEMLSCYSTINCVSSTNTKASYQRVSDSNGCVYEWTFEISSDYDFCQVDVEYVAMESFGQLITNCSFLEHLKVTDAHSTTNVQVNDGRLTPVDNSSALTAATIVTTQVIYIDPTVTSSPAMTTNTPASTSSDPEATVTMVTTQVIYVDPTVASTGAILNTSASTSSDPEATSSTTTSAHSPSTRSSQAAIVISLVVALLMLLFIVNCLGVFIYKLRKKLLSSKMHMYKEKDTNYMMPPFYDDNYAYSTYGRDAPSTVESLGVNDKVTDWIKDIRMPSIDEECGLVISENLTNEEMLDHLYGHGTTTHKRQGKPQGSVGSTDSGVGSEDGKELSQKNLYISEQHAEELLHTAANEGQVSPTTPSNEGDGRGISRPCSLSRPLLSQTGASKLVGHPDTPLIPAVGGGHANCSPKSQNFFTFDMNRLPSVSDSVFTHSPSEGNYVDHRIASTSDSACRSPNVNAGVGKASPGFANISTPSCFVHDNIPHNLSDRCATPNIGVYQPQDVAAECESSEDNLHNSPHCHPPNTNAMETIASFATCPFPFHLKPINKTAQNTVRSNDVHANGHHSENCDSAAVEVGNYVSHNSMENNESGDQPIDGSTTVCNESLLSFKFSSNHDSNNVSCSTDQHTTITDGAYMSHCESMSDVTVTMSCDHTCASGVLSNISPNQENTQHLLSIPEHCHVPTTGQYTLFDTVDTNANQASQCFVHDSPDVKVTPSSIPQHDTPPVGVYMPYSAFVDDNNTESQISFDHKTIGGLQTSKNAATESHELFFADEISPVTKFDQIDTPLTGLYVPCSTAENKDTTINGTSTASYLPHQSQSQEFISDVTVPVSVNNYISHDFVSSSEDVKLSQNIIDDEDDNVFMTDQCDAPITGLYMTSSATVEDSQDFTMSQQLTALGNSVVVADSLQFHPTSTSFSEDKAATEQDKAPTARQHFSYTTAISDNDLSTCLIHPSNSLPRLESVGHDVTTSSKHWSISSRTETPSGCMPFHVAIQDTVNMPQSPDTVSSDLCPSAFIAETAGMFSFPNSLAFQVSAADGQYNTGVTGEYMSHNSQDDFEMNNTAGHLSQTEEDESLTATREDSMPFGDHHVSHNITASTEHQSTSSKVENPSGYTPYHVAIEDNVNIPTFMPQSSDTSSSDLCPYRVTTSDSIAKTVGVSFPNSSLIVTFQMPAADGQYNREMAEEYMSHNSHDELKIDNVKATSHSQTGDNTRFTVMRENKVQFSHQNYVDHDITANTEQQSMSYNLCTSKNTSDPIAKTAGRFSFPNSSLTVAFQLSAAETTAEYMPYNSQENIQCKNSNPSPEEDASFTFMREKNVQFSHQSNGYVSEPVTNYD